MVILREVPLKTFSIVLMISVGVRLCFASSANLAFASLNLALALSNVNASRAILPRVRAWMSAAAASFSLAVGGGGGKAVRMNDCAGRGGGSAGASQKRC